MAAQRRGRHRDPGVPRLQQPRPQGHLVQVGGDDDDGDDDDDDDTGTP